MRLPRRLPAPPSPAVEALVWAIIAAVAIGLRWYVAAQFSTYLWTRDSGSYVAPAIDWLETGKWVTNPRRGPLYSLMIAAALRGNGTLVTLIDWQVVLGLITAALTVALARWRLGKAAFWPIAICALFYAAHPMAVYLERLVRNETLLAFFATVSFGAWRMALEVQTRGRVGWTLLSGLAGGLMHALKGIFPIYPLIAVAALGWQNRRRPALAVTLALCFAIPFVAPKAASKLYDRFSGTGRPPEPEDGIMFYGRTAQWTVLDGGIEPGVKAQVRGEVQAYIDRFQKTGRLDNNEIVKRTVVPSLKRILEAERPGFSPSDLNRFCWRLGAEAALHHPFRYVWQAVRDFCYLNFITAHRFEDFRLVEVKGSARDAAAYVQAHYATPNATAARAFAIEQMKRDVQRAIDHRLLRALFHWNNFWRYARVLSPVFLTTALLPLLCCCSARDERLYWLTMAALWFFYLALLSTVGRPLDRYMMPVLPIMFWTITAAASLGWKKL